jgi:hypothetical protein
MLGLSCDEQSPPGPGNYKWEGIAGFAVWPEDHPIDGQRACNDHSGDQAWRTNPVATAREFVRTQLGWQQPVGFDGDQYRRLADAEGRTAVGGHDASMGADTLGVVIHVRRLGDCWFVAQIVPREGDVSARWKWIEKNGAPYLRVRYQGFDPITFQVGWADRVVEERMRKGQTVEIPAAGIDRPGHLLWIPDQPDENTYGGPLEAPPGT